MFPRPDRGADLIRILRMKARRLGQKEKETKMVFNQGSGCEWHRGIDEDNNGFNIGKREG